MTRAKMLLSFAVAILALTQVILAGAGTATAQGETATDTIELVPVLSGLQRPVYVTNAHDGTNRLFVLEQPGRIRVLQPEAEAPAIFLDITSRVRSTGNEQGLLGLAFHPQFATNRRFFVDYTRQPDGATVIAEYRVSASDPNTADARETVLLVIPQPFENHNGGMIEFGRDGYLYIGMGDGGSANDPGNRAQDVNNLLGKILRIDVDHTNGSQPYSSPPDNPFFGATPGADEVYAYGLRNPWRFSFDRATGDLYVADVGQGAREEIDIVTRGGNYGWRVMEGSICNPNINRGVCTPPFGSILPIAEYTHTGGRCSLTGGYVYRGTRSSLPAGSYVYADFCTGEIFLLAGGASTRLLDTTLSVSSFGEDEAGEIYVTGLGGTVHRIKNPAAQAPPSPPSAQLRIDSIMIRRRSTGEPLEPVTGQNNGKKFEVVVRGEGFAAGAEVVVNGREMNTDAGATAGTELVARLRRTTLRDVTTLVIEVVNPDGARSNQITVPVAPAD